MLAETGHIVHDTAPGSLVKLLGPASFQVKLQPVQQRSVIMNGLVHSNSEAFDP